MLLSVKRILPIFFAAIFIAAIAQAQHVTGRVPLADLLEILVVDRELLAIDAEHGGQRVERLRIDERVLWTGSRGKVGMVFTNERILAVTTNSASWQSEEYEADEVPPARALLGDRVALAITSQRVLGFDGGTGNIIVYRPGIRETIIDARTGGNVAIVVTDRQAIGLSAFAGGFFPTPIHLGDKIEALSAESNIATLTSNRRILIFRGNTGSWEERRRELR